MQREPSSSSREMYVLCSKRSTDFISCKWRSMNNYENFSENFKVIFLIKEANLIVFCLIFQAFILASLTRI